MSLLALAGCAHLPRPVAACRSGDLPACGEVLTKVEGVDPADRGDALDRLAGACVAGQPKACEVLATTAEGATPAGGFPTLLVAGLQASCEAGRAETCVALARLYPRWWRPHSGQRSLSGVLSHLSTAALAEGCRAKDNAACVQLSRKLLQHRGLDHVGRKVRLARARTLLEQACDAEHPGACLALASLIFTYFDAFELERVRLAELLERTQGVPQAACERGDMSACVLHADQLEVGYGVRMSPPQNGRRRVECLGKRCGPAQPQRAAALLERACTQKHAPACVSLALKAKRKGTLDDITALRYLELGCAGGEESSCYRAGMLFDSYKLIFRDPARAADRLRRACELGEKRACKEQEATEPAQPSPTAGTCDAGSAKHCTADGSQHFLGEGPYDRAAARARYDRGCELGDPAGCIWLAIDHEIGPEDLRDRAVVQARVERAKLLLETECKAKDNQACASLARLLEAEILGVRPDPVRVLTLRKLGCKAGRAEDCHASMGGFEREPKSTTHALEQVVKACAGGDEKLCKSVSDWCGNTAFVAVPGVEPICRDATAARTSGSSSHRSAQGPTTPDALIERLTDRCAQSSSSDCDGLKRWQRDKEPANPAPAELCATPSACYRALAEADALDAAAAVSTYRSACRAGLMSACARLLVRADSYGQGPEGRVLQRSMVDAITEVTLDRCRKGDASACRFAEGLGSKFWSQVARHGQTKDPELIISQISLSACQQKLPYSCAMVHESVENQAPWPAPPDTTPMRWEIWRTGLACRGDIRQACKQADNFKEMLAYQCDGGDKEACKTFKVLEDQTKREETTP